MTSPAAPAPARTGGTPIASPRPDAAAAPAARRARVAVLGASGYSGQEFVRLARAHPGLELTLLVSREHAGAPPQAMLVGQAGPAGLSPVADPADAIAAVARDEIDTLVACLPHGVFGQLAPQFEAAAASPLRVVDLSSDHRDGAPGYVYGLPEARRTEIAAAERIANPGCYPTAGALALLPALVRGWIGGPVIVNATSGVSGAGRQAALRTSFVEREGSAELYRAGTEHPHVTEMAGQWGALAGGALEVAFAPQLVPMSRGILLVASAPLARPVDPEEAHAAYSDHYGAEPFVRLLGPGEWPDTRSVRGSNRCDVAVTTLHGGRMLLATAAIDNLVKGAAGQALQNLNLALGWPETTALPVDGTPW